ncbi:MAG: ATP-binding protein [Bacteroidia bacterium]|nr:ATP-binding protein [Bacteroidia bacterium]
MISLIPSPKQQDYPDNIITEGKYRGLNAIALYGANASGKSNLLSAMNVLVRLIFRSAQAHSTTLLPYNPFLLREGYDILPTKFEITFVVAKVRYRYGFEYKQTAVVSEYLFRKNQGREVLLFVRQEDVIEASLGFKGSAKLINAAVEATRDNALFLSTCDMLNVKEAKKLLKWFNQFVFINGIDRSEEVTSTMHTWENHPEYREKIKDYLSALDLDIYDFDIRITEREQTTLPSNPDEIIQTSLLAKFKNNKSYQTIVSHHFYGENGEKTNKKIPWKIEEESQGTQKAFYLSGPILKTLIDGGLLVVDELEAKVHPLITLNIVKLFLNKETNPHNAQIIFATHDTNLLTYAKLRRDQINFVEKNTWESSEVFALSDFKYFNPKDQKEYSERIDADKEKRYLEGRYGAIPMLHSFVSKLSNTYGEKGKVSKKAGSEEG